MVRRQLKGRAGIRRFILFPLFFFFLLVNVTWNFSFLLLCVGNIQTFFSFFSYRVGSVLHSRMTSLPTKYANLLFFFFFVEISFSLDFSW